MTQNIRLSYIKETGYGTSHQNIKYTSIWTEEMNTAGTIFFYGTHTEEDSTNFEYLVDIHFREGSTTDIIIHHYPHNISGDLFTFFSGEKQMELQLLLSNLTDKYPDRDVFTINYKYMKEVTGSDFVRYLPRLYSNAQKERKYDCFVFDTMPGNANGFPKIFIIEIRKGTEEFLEIFPAQVWLSKWLFPPTSQKAVTVDGKYLSFLTVHGFMEGKPKLTSPNLSHTNFPSKALDTLPDHIKQPELQKYLHSVGAQNIVVGADGKIIKINGDDDDDLPIAGLLPEPSEKETGEKLLKDLAEKGRVNLSDIVVYGPRDALALFPIEKSVGINVDISGAAKKMCILGGFFYAVPTAESVQMLDSEFDEIIVYVESDEQLPLFK